MRTYLFIALVVLCTSGSYARSTANLPSSSRAEGDSDDAQCVTQEGRAGKCTIKSSCSASDPDKLPPCYSLFPFLTTVCCPFNTAPGVDFKNVPGCGVRSTIAPIVGGVDSAPNSWPWAVAIFQRSQRDPTKKQFICGGSIINDEYILSASHCVVRYEGKMKAEDFFIKVGGHDIQKDGQFYDVAAVYSHENYRNWRRYNDISLFKLSKKLDFSDPTVRPVCLPTGDMVNANMTGRKTMVVGWGTTSFGGDLANNLMEVDVRVVSNDECNKAYDSVEGSTVAYPQGITDNFICAAEPEGGKDSCQGDSGGPLLYEQAGKWYQVGVVSFGYKCAEKGYPGVYTRTSNFLKWLGSHTEDTRKKQRH